MSETSGGSGWDQAEDRGPDPLGVRGFIRALVFLAVLALIVIAVFVALVIRSLDNLSL